MLISETFQVYSYCIIVLQSEPESLAPLPGNRRFRTNLLVRADDVLGVMSQGTFNPIIDQAEWHNGYSTGLAEDWFYSQL